jgi:hypothetical protein
MFISSLFTFGSLCSRVGAGDSSKFYPDRRKCGPEMPFLKVCMLHILKECVSGLADFLYISGLAISGLANLNTSGLTFNLKN